VAVYLIVERSKGIGWIRVFFSEPRGTGIFGLQNLQNFFAGAENFLSWLPHGRQMLLR